MNEADSSLSCLRRYLSAVCLSLSFTLGALVAPAVAQDIYVAQNGSGAATGVDAADAYPMTWLTSGGNWGPGSGQVGPGVTVHLVGTITTAFSVRGSGAAGSPTIIKFEPGAVMTSPSWAGGGYAILAVGQKYIVIDGGGTNNGAIYCTANGYGLANGNGVAGIALQNCSYVTVQNLAVTNLYVPIQNQESFAAGLGVWIDDANGSGCANVMVTNCLFHDEATGVSIVYGPNFSNIVMTGCTAYNCNWGGNAGDSGPTSVLNGLTISNCNFYNWKVWDDPNDNNHHNGFYAWAMSGGLFTNIMFTGNIVGPGYGAHQTSGFYGSGNAGNMMVYNNVFNGTDGTSPACAFIYLYPSPLQACTVNAFNNTIVGGGSGTGISIGTATPGPSTVYQVTNNLFVGVATAVAAFYDSGYTLKEDYNLVYNVPSVSMFMWGSGASASDAPLSGWQSGGASWDKHLNQGNPFLSASFVPQSGSAAFLAGANLSQSFTNDFVGVSRPSGTNAWDIGAFQHIGIVPPSNLHVVSSAGPVAEWTFNEGSGSKAADSSANGETGTLVNSPSWVAGFGSNSQYALSFTASSSQYVNTANFADNLANFSVTCWIETTESTANYEAPVGKFGTGGFSSGVGWGMVVYPSTGVLAGDVSWDASNWVEKRSTAVVNDGKVHFCAFTYAGGTAMILYLDGALSSNDASGGSPQPSFSNSSSVQCGSDGAGDYYTGTVDDVRIYNSALTQSQITALYNAGPQ